MSMGVVKRTKDKKREEKLKGREKKLQWKNNEGK